MVLVAVNWLSAGTASLSLNASGVLLFSALTEKFRVERLLEPVFSVSAIKDTTGSPDYIAGTWSSVDVKYIVTPSTTVEIPSGARYQYLSETGWADMNVDGAGFSFRANESMSLSFRSVSGSGIEYFGGDFVALIDKVKPILNDCFNKLTSVERIKTCGFKIHFDKNAASSSAKVLIVTWNARFFAFGSKRLKSIFTAENHFYCLIFAFGFYSAYKFVFRKNHIHAQLQSFILQFDIFGFVSFNAQIRKSAHHRSYSQEK